MFKRGGSAIALARLALAVYREIPIKFDVPLEHQVNYR